MVQELNFTIKDCSECPSELKDECSETSTFDWSVKLNHELGTPLGVALTSLTSLKQVVSTRDKNGTDINPYLDLSIQAIDKAIDKLQGFKTITQPHISTQGLILVENLLQTAVSLSKTKFPNVSVKVVVSCPSYLSIRACDNVYGTIINNLVENVFEHAFVDSFGEQSLHINASFNTDTGHLLFMIKDSGVGIDPKLIDLVQQPYVSVKKSNQSGLGLAEVHHLVTAVLGGRFDITSPGEGKGTCVKLSIPSSTNEDIIANKVKPIS